MPDTAEPVGGADLDLASVERAALLEHLLAIGTALSASAEPDELLRLILSRSREITNSDAGSVFLVLRSDPEPPRLLFKILQNDSIRGLQFEEATMPISDDSLAGHVALTGRSLNIADAYHPPAGLKFNGAFDRERGYRTCSLLVLPMLNQQRQVIGVLQLINRKRSPQSVLTAETAQQLTQPYSALEERILLSLASQAAISIERTQLQVSIENLFEGFVHASVQVIEARDPSTAGHSERVANLTVCLAEEVNNLKHGPLRDLSFDERQIREIRYASLLHDFGKVGVPEAVLGKEKKLFPEQIDALRYRFALARRELELQCMRERLEHLAGNVECLRGCRHGIGDERELARRQAKLDGWWDLLARLNEPQVLAEESAADIKAELREMAGYRFRGMHGVKGGEEPLITDGELNQLLIARGSLTEGERRAIESHVSHTYSFLRRIPWTDALRRVPDIAHGHHEKLDGSGYPLGLKAEQIPIQSQLMTVSDIYDALSAGDRPYKKGMPVARALGILREEAGRSHLNGELVQLFEQRRVYEVATAR